MAFFYALLQMTYARNIILPIDMNKQYLHRESNLLIYSWQLVPLQISYVMDIKTPELVLCKTIFQ